ncbi:MAG: tyrosine-type recombinase/integrase [Planctomycetota bacterium]|nr:tyrosine-type recombinase/integrase [Planctomycetota bacterium]
MTFAAVVEEWLDRDQSRNRSWGQAEAAMRRDALPAFRNLRLDQITRSDTIRLLDRVIERGAPVVANRLLAYLRRLFNWSLERGYIDSDPTSGIRSPHREKSRDRVLTDTELRPLLRACDDIGYPFGSFTKLLLLTGQRRREVAEMTWSEVDVDAGTWTLAGERVKNGRPHVVHLNRQAVRLLSGVPRVEGSDWVFTTTGKGPIKGFSKAKAQLDANSGITGWTLHDIRRTFATILTERLGVSPVVTDRILNHVQGSVRGVAAVYQRGQYLEDRRAALEAMGDYIEAMSIGAGDSK